MAATEDCKQPGPQVGPGGKKRISMHEGIASWCDCCSCQAEPYWAELAEELGIDLGSDYEDEEKKPAGCSGPS